MSDEPEEVVTPTETEESVETPVEDAETIEPTETVETTETPAVTPETLDAFRGIMAEALKPFEERLDAVKPKEEGPKQYNTVEELKAEIRDELKAEMAAEEERKSIAAQNEKFDAEIESLREAGEPMPRGTIKGVFELMVKKGETSFKKAYESYKVSKGTVLKDKARKVGTVSGKEAPKSGHYRVGDSPTAVASRILANLQDD